MTIATVPNLHPPRPTPYRKDLPPLRPVCRQRGQGPTYFKQDIKRALQSGYTLAEVCRAYGFPHRQLYDFARRHDLPLNPPMSVRLVLQIHDLYQNGYSVREIAKAVRLNYYATYYVVSEIKLFLGLRTRSTRTRD